MGAGFGAGFTALANDLSLMMLGVVLLGITILGLGLALSWFDRGIMTHVKDGLLRIIGGAMLVGGASGVATFITQNFH